MNLRKLVGSVVIVVGILGFSQTAIAVCQGPSVILDPVHIAIPAESVGSGPQAHVENRIQHIIRQQFQDSIYAETMHNYNVTATGTVTLTVQGQWAMTMNQQYILSKPACERFDDAQQTAVSSPTTDEERAQIWIWATQGLVPGLVSSGSTHQASTASGWWTLGLATRYEAQFVTRCEIEGGKMVCYGSIQWVLVIL